MRDIDDRTILSTRCFTGNWQIFIQNFPLISATTTPCPATSKKQIPASSASFTKHSDKFSPYPKLNSSRNMIKQIKNILRKTLFHYIKPPAVRSYSQAGEDSIINFLFYDKRIKQLTFLDIGTNRPDYGNNTYLFYKNGHRGVCVEADSTLIPSIKEIRPEDTVLNIGVSTSQETEAEFYIFNDTSLNTFDKAEAEKRARAGKHKIESVIKVPLKTINAILGKEFKTCPDLLSIDVEGLDFSILQSLDFESHPIPVICVETCTYSANHIRPKDPLIAAFMLSKGYFIYADTYINTIFVLDRWFKILSP